MIQRRYVRRTARLLAVVFLLMFAAGCAVACPAEAPEETVSAAAPAVMDTEGAGDVISIDDTAGADLAVVPLSGAPAVATVLMPEASGTNVMGNEKAEIDASNTADGYVMIRYLESTEARLKVIVTGPSGVKYYYNLNNSGTYEVFPLSDGSGSYTFQACKNVKDTSYSISYSATMDVTLKDEFAPFLLPNQYVNYTADSQVVAEAAELTAGCGTELEKIQAVYNYVVENISYDKELAATVKSGYLPDVDAVLAKGKGICFDYAAVMTAMLRSQGIPCKLVVGDAGTVYHAWINAWSETEGWLDGIIYFDGQNWKLMDPTFASSGNSSESIMAYIGNGSNYQAKYLY
jgi:hypothetical protein